jgi:hypothetical protein
MKYVHSDLCNLLATSMIHAGFHMEARRLVSGQITEEMLREKASAYAELFKMTSPVTVEIMQMCGLVQLAD